MSKDIASGTVYVKENLEILKKYYDEVAKTFKGALPLRFSGLPECFDRLSIDDEIDVGQYLF